MKIIFDKSVKNLILEAFDKTTTTEGIIVEKSNPEQRVLALDGQEITIDEFAGIKKGSQVFIKSDLPSILRLSDLVR